MPDHRLSEALKEAYASADVTDMVYLTLEFNHADLPEPIRVVHGHQDLNARLETGQDVTFVATGFDFIRPEVGSEGVPQCTLEIDNVDRAILANIEATIPSGVPITMTVRDYLESDLTTPQTVPPAVMTITNINASVFRIQAVASFGNLSNVRFPRGEYTAERFVGLVAQ